MAAAKLAYEEALAVEERLLSHAKDVASYRLGLAVTLTELVFVLAPVRVSPPVPLFTIEALPVMVLAIE